MKKYYQLLLIIVSVISVVSLIIYRNEYNRLRYVLEVLNFFGKPAEPRSQLDCFDLNKTIFDENIYNIPAPSWQRIDNFNYVYSAYWKDSGTGGEVIAVAVSMSQTAPLLMCQLWFADKQKPVTGKFKYHALKSEGTSDLIGYTFSCKVQHNFGKPYAIVFYNNQMKNPVLGAKVHIVNPKSSQKPSASVACILPQLKHSTTSNIVEFLNFHQILGVSEFIIYDDGQAPSSFYSPKLGFHITNLAWNFPFNQNSNLNRNLIDTDCLLRTSGKVENVYIMNWNEFIVPTHHTTISGLIQDFDAAKRHHQFQLSILEFCIDYNDDVVIPKHEMIMHKLHYKSRSTQTKFNIFRPGMKIDKTVSIQQIEPTIAAVHKYINCFNNEKTIQLSQSSAILRFNVDFIKTVFYKLWISGELND